MVCKYGGEIRVEVDLKGRRFDNDDVQVDGHAWFYEGTTTESGDLDGERLDRKIAAMLAQDSQTRRLVDGVGAATFRRWWAEEAFVREEPVGTAPRVGALAAWAAGTAARVLRAAHAGTGSAETAPSAETGSAARAGR